MGNSSTQTPPSPRDATRRAIWALDARIQLMEAKTVQAIVDSQRAIGFFFVMLAIVVFFK